MGADAPLARGDHRRAHARGVRWQRRTTRDARKRDRHECGAGSDNATRKRDTDGSGGAGQTAAAMSTRAAQPTSAGPASTVRATQRQQQQRQETKASIPHFHAPEAVIYLRPGGLEWVEVEKGVSSISDKEGGGEYQFDAHAAYFRGRPVIDTLRYGLIFVRDAGRW